jgi:site-specific recombinase XerC
MKGPTTFSALLEAYFMDRLMRQRRVSSHTIASYRDTFRLLLQFTQQRLRKAPSHLTLSDLDTTLLGAFLDHLERERRNTARSRNVRLAAIHSFFRYVALTLPNTAPSLSACSLCRVSAMCGDPLRSSRKLRSTRCLLRLISTLGTGVVIMR